MHHQEESTWNGKNWWSPKGVDKRGLSPNPFMFMDLLEISQTLPKGQMTGFDGTRPLRNCNPDGIRSGIRMARFGGIWRDLIRRVLAGFGGNRLLTVFLLVCKHSIQRRVSAWQATLAQIPSFPSCARRDSDSAPFCQPPFGFCRKNFFFKALGLWRENPFSRERPPKVSTVVHMRNRG